MTSVDIEKGVGGDLRITEPEYISSNFSERAHEQRRQTLSPKSDLEIFQTLVGIRFLARGGGPLTDGEEMAQPASVMQDIFRPSKASKSRFRNRGLYDRALSQDLKNRVLYTMSHYIIFSLYILQIILAAVITAVSAYKGSSSVGLTVLGASNTVVAGLLAWLTGQGMPARFRRARDQYREVVKAIEAAERTFAEADYIDSWTASEGGQRRPDPIRERDRLEKLFDQARLDQESNYPDIHTAPSSEMRQKTLELQEELDQAKELKKEKEAQLENAFKELKALKNSMVGSTRKDRE